MKVLAVSAVLSCWIYCVYSERKLPDYVNVCKRTDPEISKCWRKTVLDLKPYLVKGIPEFDIPHVDPLEIEAIRLDQGNSGGVSFRANLTNLKFYGGKDYDIPYAHADMLKTLTVNMAVTFPKLEAVGDYIANGRVLTFEFDSNGKFRIDITKAIMNGTWYFKIINKKGEEYLLIDKEDIDVDADKISMHIDDLFPNNPELTEHVNTVINENIDDLYNDFKPVLVTTLSTVSREYFHRVLKKFPFDVLVPKQ